jgi:phenylpyruvate tautomerase
VGQEQKPVAREEEMGMPLLRLQVSSSINQDDQQALMAQLSQGVARTLNKPESYMMVVLEPEMQMLMAATQDPCALAEVRSIGTISPAQARQLSQLLCTVLHQELGIAPDRTYCNFVDIAPAQWGHDGGTFG